MNFNAPQPTPAPVEIVQIVNAGFSVLQVPNAPEKLIMAFTVPNGRQYQFMLDGGGRRAVIEALGGVGVFRPGDMPV